MATATTTTSDEILHHTTTFLSEIISESDLRNHLHSTLRRKTPSSNQTAFLKSLTLASKSLENAIAAPNSATQSSSLRLAEKLLLSHPETPFSSFLLSIIYTLTNHPTKAAITLLSIFNQDPSLARSEIEPVIFEELFLIHLLPVLEWFNEQRTKILSFSSTGMTLDYDDVYDNSMSDMSVVLPTNKLLSKMSGGQALELKELESSYEEVVDENCRVFAEYFKEVLEENDGNGLMMVTPPSVILKLVDKFDGREHEKIKMEEMGMKIGRYNVMLRFFFYLYFFLGQIRIILFNLLIFSLTLLIIENIKKKIKDLRLCSFLQSFDFLLVILLLA